MDCSEFPRPAYPMDPAAARGVESSRWASPTKPHAGTRDIRMETTALACAGPSAPAAAAAEASAAEAAACGGARTQVGIGPLPLTYVIVLRRRSSRLSSNAVSRKAGESWVANGVGVLRIRSARGYI